jgi:formate dehydrogenase subunit gamma
MPPSAPLPTAQQSALDAALEAHRDRPGPLLPILHAVQDALGWIPPACVPPLAQALGLSRAEVEGVIGFYPHFHTRPTGLLIQVCRAEACQAQGGRALEAHARTRLGLDWHQTRPDGQLTLEPVFCLGNCACGPSVRIGNPILGRITPARFDACVAEALAAEDTP